MKKAYDLFEYLRPIWATDTVYNETFMFLGKDDSAPFLLRPDEILSVKNYFLTEDISSENYEIKDGKFFRKGKIPYYTAEEYYTTEIGRYGIKVNENTALKFGFKEQRYLLYGEGDTFTENQIAVTYKTREKWSGVIPEGEREKLPLFTDRINRKERINITFYGDSIMTGCNASGTPMGGNTPPYMDAFPDLIKDFLTEAFGADIAISNVSQGGWNTFEGRNAFKERVLPTNPDVLVLGFGMNDLDTPLDKYGETYREMISLLRKQNPASEIVLVATMYPNTDSTWVRNQVRTVDVLKELERADEHIALADMTSMHECILKRKRYRDMTANNINHPNDFLGRVYAQVILKTMLGESFERFYKERYD